MKSSKSVVECHLQAKEVETDFGRLAEIPEKGLERLTEQLAKEGETGLGRRGLRDWQSSW